jgi:hypothetical protein
MEMCPKFIRCSVCRCPLDPLIKKRDEDTEKRKTKCRLSKEIIREIQKKAKLRGVNLVSTETPKNDTE